MSEDAVKKLAIIPGNAQHIGARNEQQDSFGFSVFDDADHVGHAGILAVVADGMGGLAMGKDASRVAVQTFLDTYMEKDAKEAIASALDRCLHAANRAVSKMALKAGLEGEVGTTLVAVVIHEGKLYRTAAGDSRIYLFRNGHLLQLTTDYNYGRVLDRLVAKGEMQADEAASHPSRAALTSFLGKEALDDYDHADEPPLNLEPGDRILLASDGLFGFLPESEFAAFLTAEPQRAAEELVLATLALQHPYQDNITVAILGYGLPEPKSLPETRMRKPAGQVHAEPRKSKSSAGKWLKVALALAVLAVAGFALGQYFARQQDALLHPPTVTGSQSDKSGAKTPGKTLDQ